MSTQSLNNVANNMGPEIKKNLPAKYMRYMSYTYWLTTQLRNADVISAESFNEIMKAQKLWESSPRKNSIIIPKRAITKEKRHTDLKIIVFIETSDALKGIR